MKINRLKVKLLKKCSLNIYDATLVRKKRHSRYNERVDQKDQINLPSQRMGCEFIFLLVSSKLQKKWRSLQWVYQSEYILAYRNFIVWLLSKRYTQELLQ